MTEIFPITSRYYGVATRKLETAEGEGYAYLGRRFLPPSESLEQVATHTVSDGERLDHVANEHLGDPEQFWRICDANDAMRPDDLLTVGRTLRITLPEGITGPVL